MLEDLDLLTDEPSNQVVDDSQSLRDQLIEALKEADDLKVEKTRVEEENRDLRSKLDDAVRREVEMKKFEEEVFSLRKQLKDYTSEEALVKDQSKEDSVRQKEAFTEVKKQLFKQLVQEQEKNKQLETELNALKKKVGNPALLSPTKAASALRVLGFFGKTDVDEKASEESSRKAATFAESASSVPKGSSKGHTFPLAPVNRAPKSNLVLDSSDKVSESELLADDQVRNELKVKTQQCQDLRDEIQRLEDRLTNISTSYDQLLAKTDELRSSRNDAKTNLNKTEVDFQELTKKNASYLEDIQTLKQQLSSTASETQTREFELNKKLEMAESELKDALLNKEKEIESLKTEYIQDIAILKDDHEKTYIAHDEKETKLSNELQILKTSVIQMGLEHETMSSTVENYKAMFSETNDKEDVLEQRKKCLEKEKKTLIKEIVRLRENMGVLDTKLNAEKEVREQLEDKMNHLQEDHIKLSEENQTIEEDRVKYKTLYSKVVQEREAAVDFHESTMKELKTKIKAVLDIGQGILMTIENMKLEKLRCSTPGMKDVQRLQWANTEIQKSVMPTIRKEMSGEREPDSTTRFTKSVLCNMLLTLCHTLLHSNIILLKVAEA